MSATSIFRLFSNIWLIPDTCSAELAKSTGSLLNYTDLVEFLKIWYCVVKLAGDIFHYLQKNSFSSPSLCLDFFFKAQKKAILKALRISKKLWYRDDPKLSKEGKMTNLRNE